MKKLAVVVVALFVAAVPAFAVPAVSGGTGIISTPTAYTVGNGGIELGFWWVNNGSIAPSISFGVTDQLEIGGGVDFGDLGIDPIVSGRLKYRFSGSNNAPNAWALGFNFDLALGDDADGTPGEIALAPYIANTFMVSGFQFNWGLGYSFGLKSHINFFAGISRQIIENLFIDADFTNFHYRYNFGAGSEFHGLGMGNIMLRLAVMNSKLNISAGLFNAFEKGREFGFGVSYKL
jgi:hypothetical protein